MSNTVKVRSLCCGRKFRGDVDKVQDINSCPVCGKLGWTFNVLEGPQITPKVMRQQPVEASPEATHHLPAGRRANISRARRQLRMQKRRLTPPSPSKNNSSALIVVLSATAVLVIVAVAWAIISTHHDDKTVVDMKPGANVPRDSTGEAAQVGSGKVNGHKTKEARDPTNDEGKPLALRAKELLLLSAFQRALYDSQAPERSKETPDKGEARLGKDERYKLVAKWMANAAMEESDQAMKALGNSKSLRDTLYKGFYEEALMHLRWLR